MANEKFCSVCGAKMAAEAGFCPECGAKQTVVETASVAETTPVVETTPAVEAASVAEGGATQPGFDTEQIKKYLPLVGIGAAIIAIIIAIILIIVNLTKWTKIDPEELFRISYEGFEGNAVPVASFAYDEYTTFYIDEYFDFEEAKPSDVVKMVKKLSMSEIEKVVKAEGATMKDLDEYIKKEYKDLKTSKYLSIDEDDLEDAFDKAKDEDEAVEMKEALLDSIEFEIDFDKKKDKIKNGDKLKVKVEYDEDDLKEYNLKLTKDSFEVKVEGLMKAEEIDIFKDLTINCTGVDGQGNATISTDACTDFVKNNFEFYISSGSYNLSNGDEITVEGYYIGSDYNNDYKGYVDEENNKCYLFEYSQNKKFSVSGLTPLQEVDVFDYIEVTFSGIAPDLSVDVSWKDDTPSEYKSNISLSYDSWGVEFKDGDTFVVTAYAYSGFAEAGYKLKTESKEYPIDFSKFEKYIQVGDITKDAYAELMDNAAQQKAESYIDAWTWDFDELGDIKSVKSVTLKSVSLRLNKNQSDWWDDLNQYVRVYEVKCTHDKDGSVVDGTFYIVAYLKEVTIANGTLKEFTADDVQFVSTDMYEEKVNNDFLTETDVYTITSL